MILAVVATEPFDLGGQILGPLGLLVGALVVVGVLARELSKQIAARFAEKDERYAQAQKEGADREAKLEADRDRWQDIALRNLVVAEKSVDVAARKVSR